MAGQKEKINFLKRAFGSMEFSRDGVNICVKCPACKSSSKKKLAIRLDDDRINCWVCGLKGTLIYALKKYKPYEFTQEYILKFADKRTHVLVDQNKHLPVRIPDGFKLLAANLKSADSNTQLAYAYIKSRGLSEADMWKYRLGITNQGKLRGRIIMPSFDNTGTLNYYTARAYDDNLYRKYWNADADKKSIVFNEIYVDWTKELTLVEGPFDLIKCTGNATCLLGSSLTEDSLLFAKIYENKTPIVLALDYDMVEKSWQKIAKMLSKYDIDVRIIDLQGFKDVGEMSKEVFLEAYNLAKCWTSKDALKTKIGAIRL